MCPPVASRQRNGRRERIRLEVERRDVPVQMVDRRERQAPPPRQRLGGRDADEQRADEPGAGRDRDEPDVVERRIRLGERLADDRADELEMAARRDLGHDAAEARVQRGLRRDDARADLANSRDQRRSRLVARGLEPEDHGSSGSLHMINASSRLSV